MSSLSIQQPSSINTAEREQHKLILACTTRRRNFRQVTLWGPSISPAVAEEIVAHRISASVNMKELSFETATALSRSTALLSLRVYSFSERKTAWALAQCISLTNLRISPTYLLNSEEIGALAQSHSLRSLSIEGHIGRRNSGEALVDSNSAKALATMATLTRLSLNAYRIDNEGAAALVTSPSITDLSLKYNRITHLVLAPTSPLTSLNISANTITEETMINLMQSTNLKILELSRAPHLTPELAKTLSLTKLNIFDKVSPDELGELLQVTSLKSLILSLSNQSFTSCLINYARMSTITELQVSDRYWKIDAAEMHALTQIRSLTDVDVSCSEISNDALEILSLNESLQKVAISLSGKLQNDISKGLYALAHISLKSLTVQAETIHEIIDERAMQALARNPTLTQLSLCNCFCCYDTTRTISPFYKNHNLLDLTIRTCSSQISNNNGCFINETGKITWRNEKHLRATQEEAVLLAYVRANLTNPLRNSILGLLSPTGELMQAFN